MLSRFAPIADTHCGLNVGLMPPKVVANENTSWQTIHKHHNKTQEYLYKKFKKAEKQIFKGADEVITALMGDAVHGTRDATGVWNTSLKVQKDAYIALVLPWVNKSSACYSVQGTKFHVGEDGIVEQQYAQELGVYKRATFSKMEIKIQGVKIMLQHKGPKPGSREWIKKNSMAIMLRDKHFHALKHGIEPADIYLWAHFHEYIYDTHVSEGPWGTKIIHGFVLPAWCSPNEYALQNVQALEFANIGMIYFDIEGDKFEMHKLYDTIDVVERVSHG